MKVTRPQLSKVEYVKALPLFLTAPKGKANAELHAYYSLLLRLRPRRSEVRVRPQRLRSYVALAADSATVSAQERMLSR